MRTISFILLLIPSFLFSQEVDEKYKKAASFMMNSVDLYSYFKSNFPTRKVKLKKKYYSGFIVSKELVKGDYESFRIYLHEKKAINEDSLNVLYKPIENNQELGELESLTTNNKSVLVLFFSKPYKNMLICKVFPNSSLIRQRIYEDNLISSKIKIENGVIGNQADISYDNTYRYNTGLEYAFLFDKNDNITYYRRRIRHID